MPYPSILLLGAPLVGKGTQARGLSALYGDRFAHWESSAILRAYADTHDDERAQAVKKIFSGEKLISPKLLNDEDLAAIITQYGVVQQEQRTLLLDGVIRTIPQAELLKETFDVKLLLYFDHRKLTDEQIAARVKKRNRPGETLKQARERFQIFEEKSKPLLSFYRDYPERNPRRVVTIDASREIHAVLYKVCDVLKREQLLDERAA